MTRYLVQRFISLIPMLVGVSILVFIAIRLVPGDLITAQLGTEAGMLSDAQRASLEAYYGLDKPPVEQYFSWMSDVLRGDLGLSVRQGQPVLSLIFDRFPVTLELAILSVIIALLIGIPLGILSAIYRNSVLDIFARVFAMIGLSVPNFLLGTLVIYVLSVYFGILPTSGNYVEFYEDPSLNLQQIIFPALTLGTSFAASVMRMTRSSMLEVLSEDYIRTARSKGLWESVIIRRHALKNAMIPVVTLVGIEFGYLLGGTFIVEQIFAIPGIGRLTINAITQRDYALVQGVTLFIAVNFVVINLLIDVLYTVIDPRVSYGD
ncbi:ABC transporter permease [Phototrophicus methaneseepsis]|uniref:ABC transporter permease n=1 Tax=Phototrophicus methaneseepsis TaxID=2710758 RepID=A0A7S8E5G1_9CHLR|nr:ABC transporter permease [Phototrophicus methaneseepsis]QPC80644.1 ABC transporter permease [Phototrophicus methaneseepsis]